MDPETPSPLTPRARQLLALYRHLYPEWANHVLVRLAIHDDAIAPRFAPPLTTLQQIHANFWGSQNTRLDTSK